MMIPKDRPKGDEVETTCNAKKKAKQKKKVLL